jgi:hypothetical protein
MSHFVIFKGFSLRVMFISNFIFLGSNLFLAFGIGILLGNVLRWELLMI